MKGWVYIITNKAMPDLLKVGYSTKDPALRANDLHNTGVPHRYIVEYDALVEEPYLVEQKVHKLLKDHHEDKEWFRCNLTEAIIAIREVSNGSLIHESIKNEDFINSQKYQQPINKDLQKIFELKLKDAEQGFVSAKNYIGYAYANGQGVIKDVQKGMEWFSKARDKNANLKDIQKSEFVKYSLGDTLSDGSIVFYINASCNHGMAAYRKDEGDASSWIEAKLLARAHGESWHLPSKEELALLYEQKDVVGGFANVNYWSDTEYDRSWVWHQCFSNGAQNYYGLKINSIGTRERFKVRAVRYF